MTDAALSQGLPKRIEYEELWEGKVITTKATKNLIPAILTGTFFTSPRGATLLWLASLMVNGDGSIGGKFHSSYNLWEIMLIPDPPSIIDDMGLLFLWVTGSVTLEASPSQLTKAMLCLSAPSSIKSHSTSASGVGLSDATHAAKSSLRLGMHSSKVLRGIWILDCSTSFS